MTSIKQSPKFWAICFGFWFAILNYLSHGNRIPGNSNWLNIPHFDKIAHFGFFFGGSGLLSAALFYFFGLSWKRLAIIVTVTMSLIGVWDEFHQSFFPSRTGNDVGDWLADTLGALCGTFVFRLLHHKLE